MVRIEREPENELPLAMWAHGTGTEPAKVHVGLPDALI